MPPAPDDALDEPTPLVPDEVEPVPAVPEVDAVAFAVDAAVAPPAPDDGALQATPRTSTRRVEPIGGTSTTRWGALEEESSSRRGRTRTGRGSFERRVEIFALSTERSPGKG